MSFVSGLRPLLVCSALFAFAQLVPAQTALKWRWSICSARFSSRPKSRRPICRCRPSSSRGRTRSTNCRTRSRRWHSSCRSSSGKLTPQAEADLTAQGQRKQRDLQRMQEICRRMPRLPQRHLSKSSAKMNDVVKKLAEEKGLDLMVDTSTTLYFKPALDLTNDAIAAYDKAYPAK